jgi:glycosyltransferase involved in cell wall biosynthesis
VWKVERAEITPPGINRRHFPPLDPTAASKRASNGFRWRLMYVGRIDENKGMSTILRALQLLPGDATVQFVGRGDDEHRAELEAMARDAGVIARVSFADVPRPALASRYLDADTVLFPSVWDEPFGLVPLEAMACGVPVVATGTGGSAEFLDDGRNCLLVPRRDETALARAVERLAASPELRARLVEGGLATADSYTTDRLADRLERLHLAETGATTLSGTGAG